jgi:hypothetical protein
VARILKQPGATHFALQPALGQAARVRHRHGSIASAHRQNQQLVTQTKYQQGQISHPLQAGHFINLTI